MVGLPGPVVVLGGGGFIGAHLTAGLARDGHEVRAVDVSFPERRAEWWNRAAEIKLLDLTEPDKAAAAVRGAGTVFHLAADMGGVGYFHSGSDWAAAARNGRMTLNVLEASEYEGVERIFYAASSCVYPYDEMMRAGREPFTEDEIGTGTPDALYGAEKLHGLRLVDALPGGRVGVFDTIYGPGADGDSTRSKFPPTVAFKAIEACRTGTLELWGTGRQRRCFLWVEEAVRRIMLIAASPHHDGPVNVGSPRPRTCREVASMCLAIAGAPDAAITTNEAAPTGAFERVVSVSKYARLFGAVPDPAPEEGFRRLIEWMRSHP